MDMRTAAAQTKVINLSSNISALVTFILTGNVYYTLGAAASVCSVAGHYLGAGLVWPMTARRLSAPWYLLC